MRNTNERAEPTGALWTVYSWMIDKDGMDLCPTGADVAVFAFLYEETRQGSKSALIAQKDIAAAVRISRQTVNVTIQHLIAAGLIKLRKPKRAPEGKRAAMCYRVNLDKVREAVCQKPSDLEK